MGLNGLGGEFDDVSVIFDNALAEGAFTDGGALGLKASGKLIISGWMVESQILNDSSTHAYIDMYYWRCKRPTANGVIAQMTEGIGDMGVAGATAVTTTTYGFTPFQVPQFSRTTQVWKKVRVKLAPSGVTQVGTRSGKNYIRNWGVDEEYSMDRNCTEGILMCFYGAPSGSAAVASPITLRISTNKTYTYSWVSTAEFELGRV